MEEHHDQSLDFLNLRFLVAAFAVIATLSFVSGAVFGADKTPQQMLRVLATQTIDWQKVHVVQVDERVAPFGSPERNLTQLRDALLSRVSIPASQVYTMRLWLPPRATTGGGE